MAQSREVLRAKQYGELGHVLAKTSQRLGVEVDTQTEEAWARTVTLMATADDISEQSPETLNASELLKILRLDEDNPELLVAASDLLAASEASRLASTISRHFDSRAIEATNCSSLLRHQSPILVLEDNHLWEQLELLVTLGTYVDSFVDCREDATDISQFTASQLATGALSRIVKVIPKIEAKTLIACSRSAGEVGIRSRIVRRMGKPLFGANY